MDDNGNEGDDYTGNMLLLNCTHTQERIWLSSLMLWQKEK